MSDYQFSRVRVMAELTAEERTVVQHAESLGWQVVSADALSIFFCRGSGLTRAASRDVINRGGDLLAVTLDQLRRQ